VILLSLYDPLPLIRYDSGVSIHVLLVASPPALLLLLSDPGNFVLYRGQTCHVPSPSVDVLFFFHFCTFMDPPGRILFSCPSRPLIRVKKSFCSVFCILATSVVSPTFWGPQARSLRMYFPGGWDSPPAFADSKRLALAAFFITFYEINSTSVLALLPGILQTCSGMTLSPRVPVIFDFYVFSMLCFLCEARRFPKMVFPFALP